MDRWDKEGDREKAGKRLGLIVPAERPRGEAGVKVYRKVARESENQNLSCLGACMHGYFLDMAYKDGGEVWPCPGKEMSFLIMLFVQFPKVHSIIRCQRELEEGIRSGARTK